jgi:hypothetical protein
MRKLKERMPAFIFGMVLMGAGIMMMMNDWHFMLRGRSGTLRIEGLGVINVAVIFLLFQVYFYRQPESEQNDRII